MVTASGVLAVTAKGQIHDGIHPVNGGVVQLTWLHRFVGHVVVLVRGKANARRSHFQQVAKLCDGTLGKPRGGTRKGPPLSATSYRLPSCQRCRCVHRATDITLSALFVGKRGETLGQR